MKTLSIYLLVIQIQLALPAQTPQNTLVESGKIFVELVKIFKKDQAQSGLLLQENSTADLCFTNSTTENLLIELSRKISDSSYKNLPVSISLTINAHECFLELTPTVYHYKVFKKFNGTQQLSLEGELKLKLNEKMEREIK